MIKRRILFLTSSYPNEQNPNQGIFVKYQLEALRKRYETLLITVRVDYKKFGFFTYSIDERSEHEAHIQINHSFPIFNQAQIFLILFYETIKRGRKFLPDSIHVTFSYPGAFWAYGVSKILKRPYVVTEHSKLTNHYRSSIHKFLVNFALRRADQVIAVGRKQSEDFEKILNITPRIVPNIVNIERFSLSDVAARSRSTIQIGSAGIMSSNRKGFDILLQALARVNFDFIVHIGGDGEYLPAFKEMAVKLGIESKCVFWGFLPHSNMKSFLDPLDFVVSPSRLETFGIFLAEAIACGIPVVATRCGGPEDFVDDDNGLLVPTEDVEALVHAMEKMARTYKLYNRSAMREKIIAQYSEERFLENMESVYAAL